MKQSLSLRGAPRMLRSKFMLIPLQFRMDESIRPPLLWKRESSHPSFFRFHVKTSNIIYFLTITAKLDRIQWWGRFYILWEYKNIPGYGGLWTAPTHLNACRENTQRGKSSPWGWRFPGQGWGDSALVQFQIRCEKILQSWRRHDMLFAFIIPH